MPAIRRRAVAAALAAAVAVPSAALAAPAAKPAARPASAPARPKLKVAAVYTVPAEQLWVSRIDKALKAAAARGEIDYVLSENVAAADYERVLRQYAEQGVPLIVGESFSVEEAARKVAKAFPKTAFLMGSSGKPQRPNFSVFENLIHEASYLSGMVAAGMSRSGRIGLVAGHPIPETNRLMNAFMAGAKEVNPRTRFSVAFIDSSFDPPKARAAATDMIDDGVDVLYAERFGVADAAKERQVLAIGNVINTQDKYPETIVTAALWHMEPTVEAAIAAVRAGRFVAEDYGRYSAMRHGGSALAPFGSFDGRVPAALKARIAQKRQAIVAGTFRVRIDDRAPRER